MQMLRFVCFFSPIMVTFHLVPYSVHAPAPIITADFCSIRHSIDGKHTHSRHFTGVYYLHDLTASRSNFALWAQWAPFSTGFNYYQSLARAPNTLTTTVTVEEEEAEEVVIPREWRQTGT